jgi:hypothetical protein
LAERNAILEALAAIALQAVQHVRPDTSARVGDLSAPAAAGPGGGGIPAGWQIRVFFHADQYEWQESQQEHELRVIVALMHMDDSSSQTLGTTELLRASAAYQLISDAIWRSSEDRASALMSMEGVRSLHHDVDKSAGIQVHGLDDGDRRCSIGEVFVVRYIRMPPPPEPPETPPETPEPE